jgi:hypothetical protein
MRFLLFIAIVLGSMLVAVQYCGASVPLKIDSLISTLEKGESEEAEKALAILPRLASSNIRAQKAALSYLHALDKEGHCPLLMYSRSLADFDSSFAVMLLKDAKNLHLDETTEVFFATIALMQKRDRNVADILDVLLKDKDFSDNVGAIRVLQVLYEYKIQDNISWITQQIKKKNRLGGEAIFFMGIVGLGPDSKMGEVNDAIADWFLSDESRDDDVKNIDNEEQKAYMAMALAKLGCRKKEVIDRIKNIYSEKQADVNESGLACMYAYALTWMDKPNEKDYWRFIMRNYEKQGMGGYFMMTIFATNMDESAKKTILSLKNDSDNDIKIGVRHSSRFLLFVNDSKKRR